MTVFFMVLIVLVTILISFFILIQNPKGGGVDLSVMGGTGSQFFGVQKSTDILEKGTWFFAIIIFCLCLSAPWFMTDIKNISKESQYIKDIKTGVPIKK